MAQSVNIPLQLEQDADGAVLTIDVGINGAAPRPGRGIRHTMAGYIVAANGQALSALPTGEGPVPGSTFNCPQPTQCAIASCNPIVMLGFDAGTSRPVRAGQHIGCRTVDRARSPTKRPQTFRS